MILARKLGLRRFANLTRGDGLFINKDGRMLYDIPMNSHASKIKYKINEDCPQDAEDFPLKNITIKHLNDTPDFDIIPKLEHGLNKLLDGKIYMGDMGFGKIPQLGSDVTSQMSVYKPPSEDKKLLQLTE